MAHVFIKSLDDIYINRAQKQGDYPPMARTSTAYITMTSAHDSFQQDAVMA